MTATTDRITELLTKAGAKSIQFGQHEFFEIRYVRFALNGGLLTRYGTTPADLLTRVEHWLRQSSKQ